jgi:hypothetical protein
LTSRESLRVTFLEPSKDVDLERYSDTLVHRLLPYRRRFGGKDGEYGLGYRIEVPFGCMEV